MLSTCRTRERSRTCEVLIVDGANISVEKPVRREVRSRALEMQSRLMEDRLSCQSWPNVLTRADLTWVPARIC